LSLRQWISTGRARLTFVAPLNIAFAARTLHDFLPLLPWFCVCSSTLFNLTISASKASAFFNKVKEKRDILL
ncbi:hypothetical protein KKA08_04085, partial [bacterium]|nr:hypothetical protein [bacterium]